MPDSHGDRRARPRMLAARVSRAADELSDAMTAALGADWAQVEDELAIRRRLATSRARGTELRLLGTRRAAVTAAQRGESAALAGRGFGRALRRRAGHDHAAAADQQRA